MTQIPAQQTNKPSAQGWGGLIEKVNSATDLPTFHQEMHNLQCKIVTAEYGAFWVKGPDDKPLILNSWPNQLDGDQIATAIRDLLGQSAQSGFERQTSHVLKVSPEGQEGEANIGAHVFVTVLRASGKVAGVITAVADCQDPNLIATTSPMRELAAGLYEVFVQRESARQANQEAQTVRNAVALLGTTQEAEGFIGAGLNLVNELARQLNCSRVTLGWIKGRGINVMAMSDTEELKRHSEYIRLMEVAMGECLDQQQPVAYPIPQNAEPMLAEAVVYSHKKLLANNKGSHITSIPLRLRDEWVGVVTLEREEEPFDGLLITQLQLIADVVAPQLADRYESDRWLVGHAWNSVKWLASYAVGPKHVGWKLLSILVMAVLIYVFVGSMSYKISADFTMDAQSKRIIPAPYEGDLGQVRVRPGAQVVAGDVLAILNTTELKLQLGEAVSQLHMYSLQRQKARAEAKIAEAQQAQAAVMQTQARINLLQYQIDKSTIRSPIDGVVLTGDWYDKVGGVVEKGKAMFEVAPLTNLTPTLRISEQDIDTLENYIHTTGGLPTGSLTTRSQPDQDFKFYVRQILPLATPVNGENVFEVRSRFASKKWSNTAHYEANDTVVHEGILYRAAQSSGPPPEARQAPENSKTSEGSIIPGTDDTVWQRANWLRPGMEGLARVDMGKRKIWWVATHRLADMIRLWMWW
ncbi:MAG: HlyD family efflux transporter periplasmic adaptor subunit [Phycisphaeraceae bacterium]|nr:HlyD family efflux transporter periplasmic adaptor subunit [Phycisphaeraceae bacterium]